MRTLVDLPDSQIHALAELGKKEDVSRAELIRRAIDNYLELKKVDQIDVFGILKTSNNTIDGMDFQTQIRDEW